MTKINDALNLLDLEFAATYDQDTGDEVYAIVSLVMCFAGRKDSYASRDDSRSTEGVMKLHKSRQITHQLRLPSSKQLYVHIVFYAGTKL